MITSENNPLKKIYEKNTFKCLDNRIGFLDALRGFAILGVLLIHTNIICPIIEYSLIFKFISFGARGVQLFYIVSAITLMYSFYFSHKKEKNPLINYFIRRFFRIAPLYYLSIFFYLFYLGNGARYWLGDEPIVSLENIISHLLFINGWNPYYINSIIGVEWSVAVEIMFYLALPIIFLKVDNLKKSFILMLLSILCSCFLKYYLSFFSFTSPSRLWLEYLSIWFPSQFPFFCLGIFLFFLIFKNEPHLLLDFSIQNQNRRFLLIIVIISIVFIISIFFLKIQSILNYIICLFFFSLFILCLAKFPTWIIVNFFSTYLGKISFSCYLLHMAIINILINIHLVNILNIFLSNSILCFIISYICLILLTTFFSHFTYKFIELSGINYGKRVVKFFENKM